MGDYRIIVKECIDKDVFLRVQAVYNDLHIPSCGRCVEKSEEIIEINYCMEGRYECDVNSQYCFYASPGDLSIGNVGRREAAGSFPTGRFQGVTLFIELEMMRKQNDQIIREMEIDQELLQYNNMHVCLSQKNVQLAKNVRKIITNDLSSHVTLNELSKELHSSPTAIKNAFKNV